MKNWLATLGILAAVLCLFALPAYALDATPPDIPTEGDVWDGVTIT